MDYLPLSPKYNDITNITLNSPIDGFATTNTTPSFNFTVTGLVDSYYCELFLNNVSYGAYYTENDTEFNYTCVIDPSYPWTVIYNCAYSADENWSTYSSIFDNYIGMMGAYIYENYQHADDILNANITIKTHGGTSSYLQCYNSSAWETLAYFNSDVVYNQTIEIPSSCIQSSVLQVRTYKYWYPAWAVHPFYYESKVIWFGVENNTPVVITPATPLAAGTYTWYINCSTQDFLRQSETRTIYIDLTNPQSNSPSDATYPRNAVTSIGWILTDNVASGYYTVKRNGTVQNSSTWTNGTNLNIWVNTTSYGTWNYTVDFNDSVGNNGTQDSVIVNITNCMVINSAGSHSMTGNVDDSDSTACINITANNVVLNCLGYHVDGDGTSGSDSGIYVYHSSGQNVNVTIQNCNSTGWPYGLYVYNSYNVTIKDSNFNQNAYGVYNKDTISTNITNCSSSDNTAYDFYFYAGNTSNCDNSLSSVTGTNGNPIEYYKTSSIIQNKTLSTLILCNAGNSNITNVTLDGGSVGWTLVSHSDNVSINQYTATNCKYGIYTMSDGTVINNSNFLSCNYGIHVFYSGNQVIANNTFNNSGSNGIWLFYVSSGKPTLIYNNLFNETSPISIVGSTISYFNTTNSTGIRIVDSAYFSMIGGNYWTNPSNTGYSNTCNDDNHDGFCDMTYEISGSNIDYLPYAAYDICNTTLYMWNGDEWEGLESTYLTFRCMLTETNCDADYQTTSQPVFNISRQSASCTPNYLRAWVNESSPTGMILFCDDGNNSSLGTIINTTKITLDSNLSNNVWESVWCWMNYSNPTETWYYDFYLDIEM